ncbi:MAG: DNA mismatch repair endonuclease MutL, partial [Bacillota bacterium]|nr:DNA mismatch repair endonuclease MutL [Bacillota bacterium]
MSKKIEVLQQEIANQIAAGEVAERPTLIIKELVENSIDAGADSIRIFLKNSGFDEIRVIDNGEGIAKDDIQTAFLRHATSKLRQIEDLETLYTMGFRGEALASIAAVSRVSMATKAEEQDTGYKIIVEGGEFLEQEPAPCNKGTEIIVRDLFYNTPARKKFLATPTRELRDTSDMVGRIIIAHPHIAIELRNNNKKVFQSPGKGDMRSAIMSVYDRELVKKLIPLDNNEFEGYISHPGYNKPSRNYYHFYINRRYIQSDSLNRAIETAYHTMMPERRFPIVFINIHIDPSQYDINVHPNKLDVKFNKEAKVEEKLIAAVGDGLLSAGRAYGEEVTTRQRIKSPPNPFPLIEEGRGESPDGIEKNSINAPTISNHRVKPDKFSEMVKNQPIDLEDISEFNSQAWQELTYLDADEVAEKNARKEARINQERIIRAFKNAEANSPVVDSKIKKVLAEEDRTLELSENFNEFTSKQKLDLDTGFYSSLTILGQLAASFIVAADEDALYLIDQHAAHERLLFNSIKNSVANSDVLRQPLLIPLDLKSNYRQYSWILENIILLR